MDKQRSQAYLTLIQKLLDCPDGQVREVLQAHSELVDPGFVQAVVQAALSFQQQGDGMTAEWLQRVAMHLADSLGLGMQSRPQPDIFSENAEPFIFKIFQRIEEAQSAEEVHEFLTANQAKLTPELLVSLPDVAVTLLSRADDDQRRDIAAVITIFGDLIQRFSCCQYWLSMELAIVAYEQVLTVTTQVDMPVDWARIVNKLATAYRSRICGDRSENVEWAVVAYKQVLT